MMRYWPNQHGSIPAVVRIQSTMFRLCTAEFSDGTQAGGHGCPGAITRRLDKGCVCGSLALAL